MKLTNKIASATLVTALVFAAQTGFAADRKGVQINGVVNQTTVANGTNTIALGRGAKASASIGAIHDGTTVNGVVNQTTVANNTNTIALGRDAKACTEIGSIGSNPACD